MTAFHWTSLPDPRSQRRLLRALRPADSADLFAIDRDPEVMECASAPPFADAARGSQLLGSIDRLFRTRQALECGVMSAHEQCVIGTCGIHTFTADGSVAEIGCLLARRSWGQGYMPEALTSIIDLAFDTLGLIVLLATIDAPNHRSQRLFHGLGFHSDPRFALLLALSPARWATWRSRIDTA